MTDRPIRFHISTLSHQTTQQALRALLSTTSTRTSPSPQFLARLADDAIAMLTTTGLPPTATTDDAPPPQPARQGSGGLAAALLGRSMRGSSASTSTSGSGATAAATAAVSAGQTHGALLVLSALLPASPLPGAGEEGAEEDGGMAWTGKSVPPPRAALLPSLGGSSTAHPLLCERVTGILQKREGPSGLRRAAWVLLPSLAALDPPVFWYVERLGCLGIGLGCI